jgi:seryl-tRNA synthetase
MIDIHLLREHPEEIKQKILKKDPTFQVDQLINLDQSVRSLKSQLDELRSRKNELAKQGQKGVTAEIREQSILISKDISRLEALLAEEEAQCKDLLLRVPNILMDDIPFGGKESNRVVRVVGEKPTFSFSIKNHLELAKQNRWIDFEAASKMTGNGFALYRGEGVKLLYALAWYLLKNNIKHGFEPILPPYLVTEQSLIGASNLPRFREEVYELPADNLFLTPTAEVNLANLYRDTIFMSTELPIRMTAWTSCFRREAGGYGAAERGLIRIHQFEKVELFSIVRQEHSEMELERMVACAEDALKGLGLHYRVSLLAAQDCSFASAKTFDIEVWLPGQNEYKEVSSASNCTDFQSRRTAIRYRTEAGEKPLLAHTLNASSLALPRLMVALLETYQKADGTIELPEVLKVSSLFG